MRKKIAMLHKEWSETSVRMMEGIFTLPEVRQRFEFRDFPITRGGNQIVFPAHWQPEGILFTMDEGDPRAHQIVETGIPAVRLDGEWEMDPFVGVSVDLLSFSQHALRHYERLSCPNILFVAPLTENRGHRIAGLMQRYCTKGESRHFRSAYLRPVDRSIARLDQSLADHPELEKALRHMPKPFGIVTLMENDALFLLNACRELGINVPKDAGILSGTDSSLVQFADPTISALTVDYLDVGRRGMALMEGILNGGRPRRKYERVDVTGVHARASTLGDSPLDQSVERVRQMIHERACEGITVEEILSHLDMSRPTLEKRYRELTSMSPAQHIRKIRAAAARELLLTTKLSITQVARRIGFDDPRPFMVFFKREFGQTPGAFRLAHV